MNNHDAADALLSHAHLQGRLARRQSLSPSANPHPAGSAEHLDWQRGWQAEEALAIAAAADRTKRLSCTYRKDEHACPPYCGGRGYCLDVA